MFRVKVLSNDPSPLAYKPRTYIVEAQTDQTVGYGSHSDCATAREIAIAEASERQAVYANLPLNVGPLNGSSQRIDPRTLMPLSVEQLRHVYLEEFNPDLDYRWLAGHEVMNGSPVEIIADCCLYSLPDNWPNGRVAWANSNGMAAGKTYDDAEKSALLELFERDALMNIWMSRFSPPQIANRHLPGKVTAIQKDLSSTGYQFATLDATCRSVPVVITLAYRDRPPALVLTAAARFSLVEAVHAAWRELEREIFLRLLLAKSSDSTAMPTKIPITCVRSSNDHASFYSDPENSSYASFLWQSDPADNQPEDRHQLCDQPSSIWDLRTCCQNCSISQLYYLDYGLINGHHVIRLMTPDLVPLLFGYNQFPLAHRARHTCYLPSLTPNWNCPVPPHPLD